MRGAVHKRGVVKFVPFSQLLHLRSSASMLLLPLRLLHQRRRHAPLPLSLPPPMPSRAPGKVPAPRALDARELLRAHQLAQHPLEPVEPRVVARDREVPAVRAELRCRRAGAAAVRSGVARVADVDGYGRTEQLAEARPCSFILSAMME